MDLQTFSEYFEKIIIMTLIYMSYHMLVFNYFAKKEKYNDYFHLFGFIGGIIIIIGIFWICK